MWFKNKTEEKPQQPQPSSKSEPGIGDEFEEAASQAVGTEPMHETEQAEVREVNQDRFLIKPEWAENTVKVLFIPLAVKDHPAWRLSDEEARHVGPKMQEALQAIADRYAPDLLAKVSSRHPELFNLVGVLAVLYYQKWRFVVSVKQFEASEAAKKHNQAERATGRPGHFESERNVGEVFCMDCGEVFETQSVYDSHLPCLKSQAHNPKADRTV